MIMIILRSQYEKIFPSRRNSPQPSEIPFLVFAQVIIGSICLALTTVCLVNNIAKNIFAIVYSNCKNRSFINTDICFVISSKLWT